MTESTSDVTLQVEVTCLHDLSLLSLDQATNNLYKAVSVGITLEVTGVNMLSRLPIYFNGEIFKPEDLTVSLYTIRIACMKMEVRNF